ncbi:MAG: hypothetical protein KKA79_05980 [Nanoarchaeota archaeon]|nr:hypothetical protein [Nanoarchaeota archaeon]
MKSKRAQATGAATFVLILALFMLAYVLLLPEEQRDELIGDLDSKTPLDKEEIIVEREGEINLLYTSPGMVYTYEKNELIIPINSVTVYHATEEDVQELATKIKVSKSWFSDNPELLTFRIDDKEDLEELQLFFFVNSGEGTIYIKFNGYTVFEGDISSTDSPITLPSDRVKVTNVLKIGMASGDFSGDSYTLSSVSVKKGFKSKKSSESKTFQLTSSEKAGLKKAELKYFVNCLKIDPKEQGDLTILINGREITTEHVFCDAGTQSQSISTGYLVSGRNTIEFKITKGEYTIEGIDLELQTSEKYYPQYSFELSENDYESIMGDNPDEDYYDDCVDDGYADCREDCQGSEDYAECRDDCYKDVRDDCRDSYNNYYGSNDLYIEFNFPNDEDRKKATVTVNEYQIAFDTNDDNYVRKISSYVERGSNYIKIIPKVNFEISSLKVYITDKE